MSQEFQAPLESPRQLLEMADAFKKSRILLSAVELDVFTILERAKSEGKQAGLTPEELAAAANTDVRGMDRLLRACRVLGLLRMDENSRFANTPLGEQHLVRGKETFLGSLDHLNTLFHTWDKLTPSVRTGGTVVDEPDMAKRDDSWFEPFLAAMYMRGRKLADGLVAKLDLTNVKSVLDVGGGPAAHAMAFARANPDIRVTVFDLPQATPITRRFLNQEGMEQRVRTRDGDFRHDPLRAPDDSGYDLVFISSIVHMLSPRENRALLRKAFEAANPGGWAVVLDFVMDEDRLAPLFGVLFSLNMLVGTPQGDTYTQGEVSDWLTGAGFTEITRIEGGNDTAFIQGTRPA